MKNRLLILLIMLTQLAPSQDMDVLLPDSILCERYGGWIENGTQVFHPDLFDSIEAVKLSGKANPAIADLLMDSIMSSPEVYKTLRPNAENFNRVLSDTAFQVYKSLGVDELISIYLANVIVKATVVAKNELSIEYRFFKSTYLLKIDEVYKTDWDIKIGDTIVLKSPSGLGFMGSPEDSVFVRSGYYKSYKKNSTQIFSLTNAHYYKATCGILKHTGYAASGYTDYCCAGFFREAPGHKFFGALEKAEDIRDYVNKFLQ